jgi:hypothetical protein
MGSARDLATAGHISTAMATSMPGLSGRILRWLVPRLNEPTDHARSNKAAAQ